MIDRLIDKLLEHRVLLVMLCIAAVMLTSMLIDFILRKMGVSFQLELPLRVLAIISIVLVAITYFTVVAATAIAFKVLRRSPLSNPSTNPAATYWTEREKIEPSLDYLKRQF